MKMLLYRPYFSFLLSLITFHPAFTPVPYVQMYTGLSGNLRAIHSQLSQGSFLLSTFLSCSSYIGLPRDFWVIRSQLSEGSFLLSNSLSSSRYTSLKYLHKCTGLSENFRVIYNQLSQDSFFIQLVHPASTLTPNTQIYRPDGKCSGNS